MQRLLSLCLIAPLTLIQDDAGPDAGVAELTATFAESGIHFELEAGLCAIPARIEVRNDLLEYLLVASHGAVHESLFVTTTSPAVLNTAMIALGVEPGTNASWKPKDPQPSQAELEQGASPYDIVPPQGDGFYLYAAWMKAEEVFLFRIEDLLRNLRTGRSMERHEWVYLGSRMIQWRDREEKVFAAEVLGNLVNVSFFESGDTLLTGALEDCVDQAIWMPNAWLVPERGAEVQLVFSREKLTELPASVRDRLKSETR